MGEHLNKGTEVLVHFDPKDICVVREMYPYNGIVTTISRVQRTQRYSGSFYAPQYELEGVTSSLGIPFTFTRDMLVTEEEE